MRYKRAKLFPAFLCLAFLFRMCFLSFGSISSPVISYHRGISFKRKITCVENGERKDLTDNFMCLHKTPMSELQASKSRGIFNKKIDVSLLLSLSNCVAFLYPLFLASKTNPPNFGEKHFFASNRLIELSVLRI
jgi:hypothetical protein